MTERWLPPRWATVLAAVCAAAGGVALTPQGACVLSTGACPIPNVQEGGGGVFPLADDQGDNSTNPEQSNDEDSPLYDSPAKPNLATNSNFGPTDNQARRHDDAAEGLLDEAVGAPETLAEASPGDSPGGIGSTQVKDGSWKLSGIAKKVKQVGNFIKKSIGSMVVGRGQVPGRDMATGVPQPIQADSPNEEAVGQTTSDRTPATPRAVGSKLVSAGAAAAVAAQVATHGAVTMHGRRRAGHGPMRTSIVAAVVNLVVAAPMPSRAQSDISCPTFTDMGYTGNCDEHIQNNGMPPCALLESFYGHDCTGCTCNGDDSNVCRWGHHVDVDAAPSYGIQGFSPTGTKGREKGYGSQHYELDKCVTCASEHVCANGKCRPGHTGLRCGECTKDYFWFAPSGRCEKCPPTGPLLSMLAGLLVAGAIYALYKFTARVDMRPNTTVRVMINHMQASGIYMTFGLKWPPSFLSLMINFYSIFSFDVGTLASPECTTGSMSFAARWSLKAFSPTVIMIGLYVFGRCKRLDMTRIVAMIALIANVVYIHGIAASLSVFPCGGSSKDDRARGTGDYGKDYLVLHPAVECGNDGVDGGFYLIAAPIFIIIFYFCGLQCFLMRQARKGNEKIAKVVNGDFRDGRKMFWFVTNLFKFSLVAIGTFGAVGYGGEADVERQVAFALLNVFVMLVVVRRAMPYEDQDSNMLEVKLLGLQMVQLATALLTYKDIIGEVLATLLQVVFALIALYLPFHKNVMKGDHKRLMKRLMKRLRGSSSGDDVETEAQGVVVTQSRTRGEGQPPAAIELVADDTTKAGAPEKV